jgi:hypothetical protein
LQAFQHATPFGLRLSARRLRRLLSISAFCFAEVLTSAGVSLSVLKC